jgi:hypothetical protein
VSEVWSKIVYVPSYLNPFISGQSTHLIGGIFANDLESDVGSLLPDQWQHLFRKVKYGSHVGVVAHFAAKDDGLFVSWVLIISKVVYVHTVAYHSDWSAMGRCGYMAITECIQRSLISLGRDHYMVVLGQKPCFIAPCSSKVCSGHPSRFGLWAGARGLFKEQRDTVYCVIDDGHRPHRPNQPCCTNVLNMYYIKGLLSLQANQPLLHPWVIGKGSL